MKPESKWKLPPIGKRIIKSAIGVFLCFAIYYIRGKINPAYFSNGTPYYSAIAVLWCVQPYVESSKVMAIQRTMGTFIGAFFGTAALILELKLLGVYGSLLGYFLTALMIIPVIYSTILLNRTNTAYFSCVVFLSITITHINDPNPFIFVANRVFDTMIGVIIGIGLNVIKLPLRKRTDTLFISQFDDNLISENETLSAYSKFELNRMIKEGLKFTVTTMKTPASLMQPLESVNLQLPVITMDGAALFDYSQTSYLQVYILSDDSVDNIKEIIKGLDMHCFINALRDDTLLIYYGVFKNEVEEKIFTEMRKSPYRNYVNRENPIEDKVIYIMCIDTNEKIEQLKQALAKKDFDNRLKIISYDSQDYDGYRYIKIYNKNAEPKNMIRYLENHVHSDYTVTIGKSPENDIIADSDDLNNGVKKLKSAFEYFNPFESFQQKRQKK